MLGHLDPWQHGRRCGHYATRLAAVRDPLRESCHSTWCSPLPPGDHMVRDTKQLMVHWLAARTTQ
eukprot:9729969-Lingulodinium_polyedra.AAC.1